MKAFVIVLSRVPESLASATRALAKLKQFGLDAELWEGTYGNEAKEIFAQERRTLHPISFKGVPVDDAYRKLCSPLGVLGCFHSHYRLWKHCAELNEPILIFEDDVLIHRGFEPVTWRDVLLLATGKYVHTLDYYKEKLHNPRETPAAVKPKGKVMPGAVGYGLTPRGANKLLECYANTYLPADNAMNTMVVKLQCHSHLMGRAATEKDGKISLTKTAAWETVTDVANISQIAGPIDPSANYDQ
jgi:GR25 family glycosyltransferase involved in LPS biosynthesis